jgi:GntR family transcriptional regulator, rspAB operon transcriptional repressor
MYAELISAAEGQRAGFTKKGYDFLAERILTGQLQPGEDINRRAVAEELGISLAPVNEAVSQLEMEGFIEVTPRRQTRVRIIKREEVRGLLILREAIECQAARIYCGAPVCTAFEQLCGFAQQVDASRPGTPDNERAEYQFHAALIDLARTPLLKDEFNRVMRRRIFYLINFVLPWDTQPPIDNHQALLEQLKSESPDAAESAMRHHLERGREEVLHP